jgi:GNAT superfamily N-acetyltransferase
VSRTETAPGHALVEALIDEPFYQSLLVDTGPDEPARRAALARYFAYSLGEAERTGRVVLAPDPTHGAAAWLLPRSPEVDAVESGAKRATLARLFGPMGYANYERIIAFMGPRADAVVSPEAWYLSILGVLPSAQGRGLGATLIEPTLAEADALGVTCYLETFSERAVRFYERLGFRSCAVHDEPTTGARYAIMRREP